MEQWFESLPTDAVIDQGGKQVSLRELPAVKETPDLVTFVKRFAEKDTELGRRIRIPDGSKPEEIESFKRDHLPKLVKAGVLSGPPESPDAYEFKAPDDLPKYLQFQDGWAKEAAIELHKAGFTKDQAGTALKLHLGFMGRIAKQFEDQERALGEGQTKALDTLKTEWGSKFEENKAIAGRGMKAVFGDNGETLALFNDLVLLGKDGKPRALADDPRLMRIFYDIGMHTAEDDGSLRDRGGDPTVEDPMIEVSKAMNDKSHSMHVDYLRNTEAWRNWTRGMYEKKYGVQEIAT